MVFPQCFSEDFVLFIRFFKIFKPNLLRLQCRLYLHYRVGILKYAQVQISNLTRKLANLLNFLYNLTIFFSLLFKILAFFTEFLLLIFEKLEITLSCGLAKYISLDILNNGQDFFDTNFLLSP